MNIALIGFRGTGKTTIGKRLAKRLQMKFMDLDVEIAKRAGKAIPQIFDEIGEKGFREMEKKGVVLERPAKFGGKLELQTFEELASAYREGKLHPLDLKNMVAGELSEILEPVRTYFEKNKEARETLEFVKTQSITR